MRYPVKVKFSCWCGIDECQSNGGERATHREAQNHVSLGCRKSTVALVKTIEALTWEWFRRSA